jgi:hypothetical protein
MSTSKSSAISPAKTLHSCNSGLHDKNGENEIYEGDLRGFEFNGEVVFNDGG